MRSSGVLCAIAAFYTSLPACAHRGVHTRASAPLRAQVETPAGVAARVRFAKYRGLKSWRTSAWDAKEGLPREYARIFAFQNPRRMLKRCGLPRRFHSSAPGPVLTGRCLMQEAGHCSMLLKALSGSVFNGARMPRACAPALVGRRVRH